MTQVSIIIPCFNEEKTIIPLLQALIEQDYEINEIEIIIVDGGSTDSTKMEIEDFKTAHISINIQIIDNQKQKIPSAINLGIIASSGEYIIRLDAHSKPAQPDYISRCVEGLKNGLGDNVGGVWEIRPINNHWVTRSIAAAASHPFGIGDAQYRFTSKAGEVDTVPFGSFRRSVFQRLGYYNENLLSNEDYEFNARIRKSGGRIWLDPGIRCIYYARPNLKSLAAQYWRYGYWKWKMLQTNFDTLKLRQAMPPLFVSGLLSLILFSFFWGAARWLLALQMFLYLMVLSFAAIQLSYKNKDLAMLIGVPFAIATMHFSWGSGFLWSVVNWHK